jgi:hypothetical protein
MLVFPEGAEHPVWFVKPHGPPGPKDEKAETGRLTPRQGIAEADSSTNQKVAKEMAAGETDAEQQATHLGSNQGTNGHDDDGNQ